MNKRALSILVSLVLVSSNALSVNAKELTRGTKENSTSIFQNYSLRGGNDVQAFMSGRLSNKLNPSGDSALKFIKENKSILGVGDNDIFKVEKIEKDNLGYTNVKLVQVIDGIKVKDKVLNVHYTPQGVISTINGNYEKDLKYVPSKTNISLEKAIKIAKSQVHFKSLKEKPSVEKIAIIKDGQAMITYKVNLRYDEPVDGNWDIYVNVNTGAVAEKIDNIRYDGAVTGSGIAVDGSTKSLNLYLSGSTYQMVDATKAMTGKISTYTAKNAQVEPGTLITKSTNVFNTESEKAAVSAHYNAGVVYDFYKNLFARNSIDNNGMSINSTVHYGSAYDNAFWDGSQMVYGDGDGSTFTYFSGDLDVVGHEMTHGVTEHTANLNYSYQSGALNESISDVFGVLIETYDKYGVKNGNSWAFNDADWVVGDDIYTPGVTGDALRSLANPKLYDQPDNMSCYVNTSQDNGGVHTNSGIPNKAAYLIAKTIGCQKTANIYYRALTTYLTSTSDFTSMSNAAIQAATDLYGSTSNEVAAVKNAFSSVGIIASGGDSSSDTYEPNNSRSTAYAINLGTTYNSLISSASDLDYYKVTTTKSGTLGISLTNLPADYDLYLINSSGYIVASSENGSTNSESISYKVTSNRTYYIKVAGYNGAYSTTQKYALKATLQ